MLSDFSCSKPKIHGMNQLIWQHHQYFDDSLWLFSSLFHVDIGCWCAGMSRTLVTFNVLWPSRKRISYSIIVLTAGSPKAFSRFHNITALFSILMAKFNTNPLINKKSCIVPKNLNKNKIWLAIYRYLKDKFTNIKKDYSIFQSTSKGLTIWFNNF